VANVAPIKSSEPTQTSGEVYFVAHINDDDFVAVKDANFIEWSQLTPINHEECLDCPALGICGGGCPVNAMHLNPENTIHSILASTL